MNIFTTLKKKKNNELHLIPTGLFPCLTGDDIIHNSAKDLIRELRSLVSATQEMYNEIYLPTLYRFAEFCQAMPWDRNGKPYSLLTEQLKYAIAALQLRRGLLLPQNADSEEIARQEPQWAFAVFSAGLLCNLPRIQEDRRITLHNQQGEKIALWNALIGSLYEPNAYYSVQWVKVSCKIPAETLKSALATRMISPRIIRWLSQNLELLTVCWDTITTCTSGNVLTDIIEKAKTTLDQKAEGKNILVITDEKVVQLPVKEINAEESNANPLGILLDYLLKRKNSENNTPLWLRISQGLFVSVKALQVFEADHENWKNNKNFLNTIQEHLIYENNHYRFRFRLKVFEDRRIIEGIIIKQESLDEAWKQQPLDTQFQPAINL